ncbi:MAG: isoprenylcysteine carboxylmethyltransferase family protein [Terracidiphilus sp.]
MKDINRKALLGMLRLLIMLALAVFLPAWRLAYWQGWVCLLAFFVPAIAISIYVAKKDPALLERRLKTGASSEKEPVQKIIQTVTAIVFVLDFAASALDHRFGWSSVPAWESVAGVLLIEVGFLIVFIVFKVNTYTSGIIEVAPGQTVISTGPYAMVRHPMYSGALLMLFGIPLALGSWWGELANVVMTVAFAWRLLDEERFLASNLLGYGEYRDKVKYRLVPLVW